MRSSAICLLYVLFLGLVLTACGGSQDPPATPSKPTGGVATGVHTQGPVPSAATPTSPQSNDSAALSARIATFEDWRQLVLDISSAEPTEARAKADAVWKALAGAGRVPLVFGSQVVFLYKGNAGSVAWCGTFTHWSDGPALEGRPIGKTDLWVAQTLFPTASRVEYKIALNGSKDLIQDPANPATVASGETTNSLLTLPGFSNTDESIKRAGVTPGTLSGNIPIASRSLGYMVNYRVYTPTGYDGVSRLPVLYVLDGSDFTNPRMGALPNVLDNLLAEGKIKPLFAVFIDPYDPANPKFNRREVEFLAHSEEFARFVASEVVPAIDAAYPTDPSPDARIIQGVSYGGLSATFIAASYPQVFHNLAALSPSLWLLGNSDALDDPAKAEGERKMEGPIQSIVTCGGKTGISCPALPLKIFLSFGEPNWDIGDLNSQVLELRGQGYPVLAMQVREGHAWSAWRGLLDEMLVYFLGK